MEKARVLHVLGNEVYTTKMKYLSHSAEQRQTDS